MCFHLDVFVTEYGTRVCKECGYEVRVGLPTRDQYTTNCPLVVGYSRNARVRTILEQLFQPFEYGKPCQEIVYIIKRDKVRFESGEELHNWLNNQLIPNKKYTCCHYYFAVANPSYQVPPPPNKDQLWSVLRAFHSLEFKFNVAQHPYKSFFSYNWLLRKLLLKCSLAHYVQFMKPIKCTGRRRMYSKMFAMLPTLPIKTSCIRQGAGGRVSGSPRQPFSLRDYAYQSLRQLSLGASNPSIKTLRSRPRLPA